MAKTLTSANSVFALGVSSVYPVPQILQGYAADDAFSADSIAPNEVLMGVDGKLSAGHTPVPKPMSIVLQADSDSNQIFDDWYNAEQSAKDTLFANAVVTLSGTNQKYVCTKGVMTGYQPMPDVKKILQPRKYQITWESITPLPM